MPALTRLASRAIPLVVDDIDTDQIIPARFLKVTDRTGLGRHAFSDWRYATDGTPKPDFPLNAPGAAARHILVGGRNFGCGSSREHAPWALADFGIRAVVASSFADIFRNNALKNGLVPVQLAPDDHAALVARLAAAPDAEVTVDVEACTIAVDGTAWPFPLAPFARRCLLEGVDQLGYLLAAEDEITRFEASHGTAVATSA
ncbi:MAG: 3-isopropylmalate dehydratase small subunit [Gemmatimonadaceae bacterium]|nr:3-isopropylmalate dehydratase small subunit [Gemmatimonadaceae bacterium]